MKRCLDIAGAGTLLALTLPLIVAIAFLVWWRMGHPVIFRQARPGLNGRAFEIFKFRTMHEAVDSQGHPLPDAKRLSRLGLLLRASSLDELPALWNVLRGDMSMVGPRPLLMEYMSLYSADQARRHEVRPGITGWAQVNGRNSLSWEDRFALDLWYVENRSFGLDLRILLATVIKVVRREGIAAPGHATMPRFTGSPK